MDPGLHFLPSIQVVELRFTLSRFTPYRYTLVSIAPDRFALASIPPYRFASDRFAPQRYASERFAPERFAPDRFALVNIAPYRFTLDRFALGRFAPLRYASDRFAPDRFAPDKFNPPVRSAKDKLQRIHCFDDLNCLSWVASKLYPKLAARKKKIKIKLRTKSVRLLNIVGPSSCFTLVCHLLQCENLNGINWICLNY